MLSPYRGALVTPAAELLANDRPHPLPTLLFTVREENGLHGASIGTAGCG